MTTMKERQSVASRMLQQGMRGYERVDGPALLAAVVWPSDEGGAPSADQIAEAIRLRAEKDSRRASIAA